MDLDDFPCTSCGLCCKQMNVVLNTDHDNDLLNFIVSKFPYEVSEDGVCEKLNDNNQCSVYEDRPLICNIRIMSKLFHIPYKYTIEACNELIDSAGLDPSYKINLVPD